MEVGFDFIKEMSREQLIDEILAHQRELMEPLEVGILRANVVELRVQDYKKRLAAEAGLVPTILGLAIPRDDENE